MKKKIINFVALCLAGAIALTGCSSSKTGSTETTTQEESQNADGEATNKDDGDLTVIKIGSHVTLDPDYVDPVTGEKRANDMHREVERKAMKSVEDQLGVKIEWVLYNGDTTEVLLQSVMAGDPVADLVNIYTNGADDILGQNILQPLDDYADAFVEGTMPPPIYGKHYFVAVGGGHTHPLSPLFYNINMIEAVDALKVDGETVYPTDLYKSGNWTWSVFKKYLEAIDKHYANSQGPVRPEFGIDAYRTNYTDALIQAIHSAGGSIYGDNGLEIESEPTKKAVAYIADLMDTGLLKTKIFEEGRSNPEYNAQAVPFENGETVFTNIEDWRSQYAAGNFATRNESLGFIPFPREDSLPADSPEYRQARTGGETWAILKGVPPEKAELAIKAYQLFNSEKSKFYTEINSDKRTIPLNLDTFHERVGQDMSDIYWDSISKTPVNEQSNITGVYWPFMELAGDSILGINGTPSYEIALESRKHEITDKIKEMEDILASDEVRDNVSPKFTQVEEGKKYIYPKGTDPNSIDWSTEYTVKDNIDGDMDVSKVSYTVNEADFNKAGHYPKGVLGSIKDSSENEGKQNIAITIYDAENKTAPTLTTKEEYRTVKVDEDTSKINWAGDFVETATDKDGIDLKDKITADLSTLDTTTAGEYDVKLTVEDYAGNIAEKTIKVTVEEEQVEESN